jgi:hypothetical protein
MQRTDGDSDPQPPRILLLSIVNPEVEHNGAASVTRGLLKCLTAPPLRASVECIPAKQEPHRWHRTAQLASLIKSSYSDLPSKANFLDSRKFRERVRERAGTGNFDLAILNGGDLLWAEECLPEALPRLLVAHNIEHLLYDSQIETLGGMFRPLLGWLRKDARRFRDFELEGMRSTGKIIFLSHADAEYARHYCPDAGCAIIPPLFDYEPDFAGMPRANRELQIGYMGNFNWWPNRQGLEWFATRVLPFVQTPVRLNLFGAGSDHAWSGDARISGHGFVADVNQICERSDLMICPSFAASGVCVKLAESIYNRVPLLANRHAARGLRLEDDPAIIFAEQASEWIGFLNSGACGELIGSRVSAKNAAKFAVESYSVTVQDFIRTCIARGNSRKVHRGER